MDDTLSPERIAAFLAELTELSRKHGVVIGGCGCCGSPFLFPFDDEHTESSFEKTTPAGAYICSDGNDERLRWVAKESE